jgi:hypothetical protein
VALCCVCHLFGEIEGFRTRDGLHHVEDPHDIVGEEMDIIGRVVGHHPIHQMQELAAEVEVALLLQLSELGLGGAERHRRDGHHAPVEVREQALGLRERCHLLGDGIHLRLQTLEIGRVGGHRVSSTFRQGSCSLRGEWARL